MAEFNPEMRFGNIPDFTNAPGRLIDQSGLGELFGKVAVNVAEVGAGYLDKKASSDISNSMSGVWDNATTKEAAEKADIPFDLAKGMSKFDLFQKAIEKGGISQKNALAQMEVEVKRLSNKYPQRVDEIQQAYAKATGNTAANDLYNTLAADYSAQTKADRDAQEDVQKQFNTWAPFMDSEDVATFMTDPPEKRYASTVKAAQRKNQNEKIDVVKNQLALKKAQREDISEEAAPAFSQTIDNSISMLFRGNMNKVIETFNKAKEDGNITPEERAQLTGMVEDAKLQLTQTYEQTVTTPFGPKGQETTWNQIFATSPSVLDNQKKRIDSYSTMLNNLLDNESGTGIIEFNATLLEANRKYSQSEYAKTELGAIYTQIQDMVAVGGKPVETYINENLPDIMKEAGVDDLSKLIAGQLTIDSMVPGTTLGQAVQGVSNKASKSPVDRKAANPAVRAVVESHLKTLTNPSADPKVWDQAAAYLFAPENSSFFASLSPRENQYGVSQQELAFQAFTDPKVAAAFKARGKGEQYYNAVLAWAQPVYGSLSEDIRGRAGVFVGSGNIGTKSATSKFNPETMQIEFRLDPGKTKDMAALRAYINAPEEKAFTGPVREKTGLSIDELQNIRSMAKATQRLNLVMKAQVDAMKAKGLSNNAILEELKLNLGELSPDKQDPFIQRMIPMMGESLANADWLGNKAQADWEKKQLGDNLGMNPEGTGTQLSVLEGGSTTSTVGTTPDTGDETANSVLAFIHGAEGADYNTVFGGGKVDAAGMTVADVLSRTENAGSSAFGAVQVMKKTLKGLVKNGVVTPDQKMDQATQDQIGLALLKEAGYDNWKAGKLSDNAFADRLADIWASLPIKGNKSKYEADGVNKARVTRGEVLGLLEQLK